MKPNYLLAAGLLLQSASVLGGRFLGLPDVPVIIGAGISIVLLTASGVLSMKKAKSGNKGYSSRGVKK